MTPTSLRVVTVHYVDQAGLVLARRKVALRQLSRQCREGKCPMGIRRGEKCQIARRCTWATPEAWARYIRLAELDELGR